MTIQRTHKLTIISLAFVVFIDVLTVGLVFPLFAALFTDPNGILPVQTTTATRNLLYTLIISLPMFALMFGSPVLGELSDRWGRRIVLLISLLGVFFSCLLSIVSFYLSSVVLLFISRILVAMMDGSQAIAQATIIDISQPAEKVKNMSLITLASTTGFIIGPIIGGILSDHRLCSWFGYETPFWFAAVLALANFILLKFTFVETRILEYRESLSWTTVFLRLFNGFIDKRYYCLSIGFVAAQFAWSSMYQASNLLLAQKFHYAVAKLGLYSAYLAAVFSVFLLVILLFILRYISTINTARGGIFLLALGLISFSFSVNSEIIVWLAMIPCAIGMALSYNTLMALFSDAVDEDEQGKVMGVVVGFLAIAWLLGGLLTGLLAAKSFVLTFLLQALGAFLGFIFLLIYRVKNEH